MTGSPAGRDTETRLIAALTDTARRNLPDATLPPPFRPDSSLGRSPERISSWTVPILVAAVVVALTVGALALTRRGQQHSAPPAGTGPSTFVTLRSRTAGLSAAELAKARQIISARAAALGAVNADVRIAGPDEITASLPGVSAGDVGDLGAVDALSARPLIVPPVPLATRSPGPAAPSHAPRTVDQWRSLGFVPPKDAAAYNALSASRRSAVQAVVNAWDCTDLPLDRAGAPIVSCDRDRTSKYLLGTAIISGSDVRSATTQAPIGSVGWQVFVSLTAGGQQRWTGYTVQHNVSVQPIAIANQVATVLDGVVVIASTIQETIVGDTSIASGLDQRSATALAANLTAGSLPAPFEVVSIRSR
jgi:preprotein translocase subunit SecD